MTAGRLGWLRKNKVWLFFSAQKQHLVSLPTLEKCISSRDCPSNQSGASREQAVVDLPTVTCSPSSFPTFPATLHVFVTSLVAWLPSIHPFKELADKV